MATFRPRLIVLALLVMVGQLASTAATAAVLWQMRAAQTADLEGTVCTCVHGTSGECPMHKSHKAPTSSRDQASREARFCAGSAVDAEMVLTTLAFAGPITERHHADRPARDAERVIVTAAPFTDVVLPLASPPPRV